MFFSFKIQRRGKVKKQNKEKVFFFICLTEMLQFCKGGKRFCDVVTEEKLLLNDCCCHCFNSAGRKQKIKTTYLMKKVTVVPIGSVSADPSEQFHFQSTLLWNKERKRTEHISWHLKVRFYGDWVASFIADGHFDTRRCPAVDTANPTGDGKRPERNPLDEIETLRGWGNTTPAVYETRPVCHWSKGIKTITEIC